MGSQVCSEHEVKWGEEFCTHLTLGPPTPSLDAAPYPPAAPVNLTAITLQPMEIRTFVASVMGKLDPWSHREDPLDS